MNPSGEFGLIQWGAGSPEGFRKRVGWCRPARWEEEDGKWRLVRRLLW